MNLFHQEILGVVNFVSIPAMAAHDRAGKSLRGPTIQTIGMVTVLGWPFFAFVALMALPILRVMFGRQWDASAPLAEILALAGAIGLFWPLGHQVLFALGRLGLLMRAQILVQATRVALTLGAVFVSLEAVAWALVATFAVSFGVYLWCMRRMVGLTFGDVLRAGWRSAVVAAATAAVPLAVRLSFDVGPDAVVVPLAIAVAGAGIGWLAGVFALNHAMKGEILRVVAHVAPRLGVALPK
jgi:O-antigen/teichoic acid export membrane protein